MSAAEAVLREALDQYVANQDEYVDGGSDGVTDADRANLALAEGMLDSLNTALAALAGPPAVTEPYAERVTIHQARRHFAAGGEVLVSEYGHEATRPVSRDTTTHSSASTTWEQLVTTVREWRGRYPNQRFYIVHRENTP